MAATETRLLLLGAVILFEPVNGYQLRRELLSWRVEDWAHLNPGSIYSGLATLARQGLLARHDLVDGGRPVAVYTSTESGRQRFEVMLGDALETVHDLSPLPFHTALTLVSLTTRNAALAHLRVRLSHLRAKARALSDQQTPLASVPPHVVALGELWQRLAEVEQDWLVGILTRIEAGELGFRGEPMRWRPSDDDQALTP